MSFFDNVNRCMSSMGLPVPSQVFDSFADALEVLHQLKDAWENAGGEAEMTLEAFVVVGAAAGIDETVLLALATAAGVTVSAYLHLCFSCVVGAAGPSVWDLIASTDDSWLHDQLLEQAQEQNIPNPAANA